MTTTRETLARVNACYLCGHPPIHVGFFAPFEPWNFSPEAPAPGRVRVLAYGICASCMENLGDEELARRVEAKAKTEAGK